MPDLLAFGVAAPNLDAARQQLCMVTCVYQDERSRVEDLIGLGGAVLLWQQIKGSWPASYVVARSGTNRFFIAVEGTTNVVFQVPTHLYGSFEWDWGVGGPPNGAWYSVAKEMLPDILAVLPADLAGCEVYVSGHSYGGALALLLGVLFAQKKQARTVQVLSFGAPKTFRRGYVGDFPNSYWRFEANHDPVPEIPPAVTDQFGNPGWDPLFGAWSFLNPDWVHYGEEETLYASGKVNVPGSDPNPLPPGVTNESPDAHLLRNYWGLLKQNYVVFGGEDVSVLALRLTDEALLTPSQREPTPGLPGYFKNDQGVLTWIPTGPPAVLTSSGGSGLATVEHSWVFFDANGRKWTEKYNKTADDPTTSVYNLTDSYINLRLAFLVKSCYLRSIKSRDVSGVLPPAERLLNLYGLYGLTGTLPDLTTTAVVMRLVGLTGGQRLIWFRGVPDSEVERDPVSGVDLFRGLLKTSVEAWLAAQAPSGYAILNRTKPVVGTPSETRYGGPVTGLAQLNRATVSMSNTAGYAVGARVRIARYDEKRLPGFNGEYTLLAVTPTFITVGYRTPAPILYTGTNGQVRLIVPRPLNVIDGPSCQFSHYGTRQTKSLQTNSRGAAPSKRLRKRV